MFCSLQFEKQADNPERQEMDKINRSGIVKNFTVHIDFVEPNE